MQCESLELKVLPNDLFSVIALTLSCSLADASFLQSRCCRFRSGERLSLLTDTFHATAGGVCWVACQRREGREQLDGSAAIGYTSLTWAALPFLAVPNGAVNSTWLAEWQRQRRQPETQRLERDRRPEHTHTHSSLYSNCSLPQLNATVALSGLRCECDVCLRIIYYCIWSCHLSEERWLWSLCKIWPFF